MNLLKILVASETIMMEPGLGVWLNTVFVFPTFPEAVADPEEPQAR